MNDGPALRIERVEASHVRDFVELHVLEASRRLGVASRLVGAVIDHAGERGLRGVRLLVRPENDPARRMYARAGFTESPTVFGERLV